MRAGNVDGTKYQIGKTKLFMKDAKMIDQLEESRTGVLTQCASLIQSHYRGYEARKAYKILKRQRRAAVRIQRFYRFTRRRREKARQKLIHQKVQEKNILQEIHKFAYNVPGDINIDDGDHLHVIESSFLCNTIGNVLVEFSGRVTKYSKKCKAQERFLILSTNCLFIVGADKKSSVYGNYYKIKRKLRMHELKRVSISSCEDRFMILHTEEYDTILETQLLPEILARLAAIYELDTEKTLDISVVERTEVKMKNGLIRQVGFSETGTSKIVLSLSMNNIYISHTTDTNLQEEIQDAYLEHSFEEFEAQLQRDSNQEHAHVGASRSKIHHRSSKIDVFAGYEELISGTFTTYGGQVSSRGIRINVPENAIKKNIQSITILVSEAQHQQITARNSECFLSDLVVISSRTQHFKSPIEVIIPLIRKPQNYKDIRKYARWTDTLPNEEPRWTDMKVAKGKPGLYAAIFEYNCARFETTSCGMVYLAAHCNEKDLEISSSEGSFGKNGKGRKGGRKSYSKHLSPYDNEDAYFHKSDKKKKGILKTIRSSFRHAFHSRKKKVKKTGSDYRDTDTDHTYESFSEYTDSQESASNLMSTDRTEESADGPSEDERKRPPRPPPPRLQGPPTTSTGHNSRAAEQTSTQRPKMTPPSTSISKGTSSKTSPKRPPPPPPPLSLMVQQAGTSSTQPPPPSPFTSVFAVVSSAPAKKSPPLRPPPPHSLKACSISPSTPSTGSIDSSLPSSSISQSGASTFTPPPPPVE